MKGEVWQRVLAEAEHILNTGDTVRGCAERFGVSKTTVHKDMRERLPRLDGRAARRVDAVLRKNLEERHIRGGEATRRKYRGRHAPSAPPAARRSHSPRLPLTIP